MTNIAATAKERLQFVLSIDRFSKVCQQPAIRLFNLYGTGNHVIFDKVITLTRGQHVTAVYYSAVQQYSITIHDMVFRPVSP